MKTNQIDKWQDRSELKTIDACNLPAEAKFLAHIMWSVRNYVVERQAIGPVKAIETWEVEDIIEFARSLQLR